MNDNVEVNTRATGADSAVPRLHRRTIVKGAAWSVPLIAAAAAAPAYAVSGCTQVGQLVETRATTQNFATARPEVPVTIPAGVTRMHFVVVGGDGGYAVRNGGYASGKGAYLEGDVAVTAGSTFYLQAGAGGEFGWYPDSGGGYGRGGKSLYGNGGNGGASTASGAAFHGDGGGGASALLDASRSPIAVAGGGGGSNTNFYPDGPNAALYSASLEHDQVATYGSSSVTAFGGACNAGLPGVRGQTGSLGWMGQRSSLAEPTPTQIVLMSGGGIGGGAGANSGGAGGVPQWVAGPDFANYWARSGSAGSGRNGGNGAAAPGAPTGGGPGGGGGGFSGGGGGAAVATAWWGVPAPYDGKYGIAGAGGGGSSYLRDDVTNRITQLDPRPVSTDDGEMGYVQVTFYTC
ncbi:glycine rich domain-containing protein [Microbacterium esteraromaticum]|uniref:glycine rich domain-containing protein n=1 Tax=Microbacterium esteraromaticum TaxID=57043 RepID=UPI002368EAE2|nr:glycine rich domain-containing protein [Microbacterium esteraromaticum]WDH78692.1 glycine rich domain-containing protein [Microbacterium esteraromaticum]